MKNENEIELAWALWHYMARLIQLVWEYYENEFVERYIKLEEEKSWDAYHDKDLPSNKDSKP